jgi:hypothetical protein
VHAWLDRQVRAGYESGIWHSIILHSIVLLCLALLWDHGSADHRKPIVIAFRSQGSEPELGHEELGTLVECDEVRVMLEAADEAMADEGAWLDDVPPITVDAGLPDDVLPDPLAARTDDAESSLALVALVKEIALPRERGVNRAQRQAARVPAMATATAGIESGQNGSGSGAGWNLEAVFRQRLTSSGAKTGDIQVSLMWDSHDDIDLHVTHRFEGCLDTIFWRNRMSRTGGLLDVDMNANGPLQPHAIENIFWPFGNAPCGEFVVGVHFFRSWTGQRQIPVTIRIKSADSIDYHQVTVHLGAPVTTVAVFRNGEF